MGHKILLTLIIIVAMFPKSVPENIFPGPTLLSFLSLTFLIVNVMQWKKCGSKVTRLSLISISLLFFYVWGGLGYFFTGSLDTSYSLIIQYLGALFLYLGLILYIKDEAELHKLLWIGLLCVAMHSLSVFALNNYYPYLLSAWISTWVRSFTHFGNPNIFSSYILFFIPQAFYLSTCSYSNTTKNIARLIFVFLLLTLGFSWWGTRGGTVVAFFQLSVIAIYLLYQKDSERVKQLLVLTLISIIIYSYTKKGILFFNFDLSKTPLLSELEKAPLPSELEKIPSSNLEKAPLPSELEKIPSPPNNVSGLDIRIHYWQGALGIIKDHWLAGVGPGNFYLIAPLYLNDIKDQRSIDMERNFIMNPSSAHNLFLNITAESGVIGLSLFLILIYSVFSKSCCLIRNAERCVHDPVFYAAVSISGYLIHNLVEFNWYPSEFIYTFTIMVFIIDFSARKYIFISNEPENIFLRGFPVAVWGIILFGGAITLNYYFYLKTIKPDNVFINRKVPMWEKNIERAKVLCPKCADPFLIKGKKQLNMYYSTLNPVHLAGSKHQFDTAIRNNPLDLRALPYLVQSLTLLKKFQRAKDVGYKLLKYQRYEFIGRMELAIIMLVEANVTNNSLSEPKQIVKAWEHAVKKVGSHRKRVAEGLEKAIERRQQFKRQKY
jgi:hypothetical protein